jgi:hypothetical protein
MNISRPISEIFAASAFFSVRTGQIITTKKISTPLLKGGYFTRKFSEKGVDIITNLSPPLHL